MSHEYSAAASHAAAALVLNQVLSLSEELSSAPENKRAVFDWTVCRFRPDRPDQSPADPAGSLAAPGSRPLTGKETDQVRQKQAEIRDYCVHIFTDPSAPGRLYGPVCTGSSLRIRLQVSL